MRKIKLKAQVKPKCNCEDHYLELCTSFDGETSVYQAYCYKCGKWWTYSKHEPPNDTTYLVSKLLTEESPRVIYEKNNITVYDGYESYEVWSLDDYGYIGELLYQGNQYPLHDDSVIAKCANCSFEYPAKYRECCFCGSKSREWTIDLLDESQHKKLKELRRKNNGKSYGRSRKDAGR